MSNYLIINAVVWLIGKAENDSLKIKGDILGSQIKLDNTQIVIVNSTKHALFLNLRGFTYVLCGDSIIPAQFNGELIIKPELIINNCVSMPIKMVSAINGTTNLTICPKRIIDRGLLGMGFTHVEVPDVERRKRCVNAIVGNKEKFQKGQKVEEQLHTNIKSNIGLVPPSGVNSYNGDEEKQERALGHFSDSVMSIVSKFITPSKEYNVSDLLIKQTYVIPDDSPAKRQRIN